LSSGVRILDILARRSSVWRRLASHPQLAHRLDPNRFITDLIADVLPDPGWA
jgi:hypothetical protein